MSNHIAEFESLIKENEIVFIDFWAEWCAPCKQFSRVYEEVSGEFPTILFTKVNIEEQKDLAEFFDILSIPHLMIFKESIAIYSEAGSMPASTLRELAHQALDADMTELKEQFKEN